MSRSFVRAWATVATIMALVCFAFVEPMPEHGDREHQVAETQAVQAAAGDQIGPGAPFVDSLMTGKTFTPYLTIDPRPSLHHGGSRIFVQARVTPSLRGSTREPPTRPG